MARGGCRPPSIPLEDCALARAACSASRASATSACGSRRPSTWRSLGPSARSTPTPRNGKSREATTWRPDAALRRIPTRTATMAAEGAGLGQSRFPAPPVRTLHPNTLPPADSKATESPSCRAAGPQRRKRARCPGSIVVAPPWLEPLPASVVPPTRLHEARHLPPRHATASLQYRVQQTPRVPCPARSVPHPGQGPPAGRGQRRIGAIHALGRFPPSSALEADPALPRSSCHIPCDPIRRHPLHSQDQRPPHHSRLTPTWNFPPRSGSPSNGLRRP